jgi:hypothetical protein
VGFWEGNLASTSEIMFAVRYCFIEPRSFISLFHTSSYGAHDEQGNGG